MTESTELSRPATSRRRVLGYAAAIVGLGVAGTAAWFQRSAPPAMAPPPADWWEQRFPALGGQPVAMATYKGSPLLLNFWASWCPPCIQEMPLLDQFYQQQHQRGWNVLGMAIDQPAAVQKFLAAHPVRFPVVLAEDTGMDWARKMGNVQAGLPFTVLFAADGSILNRHAGGLHIKNLNLWVNEVKSLK